MCLTKTAESISLWDPQCTFACQRDSDQDNLVDLPLTWLFLIVFDLESPCSAPLYTPDPTELLASTSRNLQSHRRLGSCWPGFETWLIIIVCVPDSSQVTSEPLFPHLQDEGTIYLPKVGLKSDRAGPPFLCIQHRVDLPLSSVSTFLLGIFCTTQRGLRKSFIVPNCCDQQR
jgi:hypothetical protein